MESGWCRACCLEQRSSLAIVKMWPSPLIITSESLRRVSHFAFFLWHVIPACPPCSCSHLQHTEHMVLSPIPFLFFLTEVHVRFVCNVILITAFINLLLTAHVPGYVLMSSVDLLRNLSVSVDYIDCLL